MHKEKLIEALAKKAGITKVRAEKFLNAFTDTVIARLKQGEKVAIAGFGTFSVKERPARLGVNPRNPSQKIQMPAVRVAKFKTGLRLRQAVKK